MRLAIAFLAHLTLLSPATASLAVPTERPWLDIARAFDLTSKPLPEVTRQASSQQREDGFVMTTETEVMLNGRCCKFQEVPSNASIVHLEVASDRKTLLKIYFRSEK